MQLIKHSRYGHSNIWNEFRYIVGKEGTKGPDQRGALNSPFVKPVEIIHSVFRLKHLLCSCLKREHIVRSGIDLFDMVG